MAPSRRPRGTWLTKEIPGFPWLSLAIRSKWQGSFEKNHMILFETQGYKMKIAGAIFIVSAHDRRAVKHKT